jgi:DnaJ-class molecular chaperone
MHDILEQEYIDLIYDRADTPGPFTIDCAFCRGTGVHPATMHLLDHSQCPTCRGRGTLRFINGRENYQICPQCSSTGREPESAALIPCCTCGGDGITRS